MTTLLTDNLPLLAGAPNGIKKLRELILELAVRGKLVPQDPSDEPASELLKRIAEEKARLVAEGKIRKQKALSERDAEDPAFELPAGWAWARLADVVNVLNGRAYKKEELLDAGTPVLRVGNLFTSNHWYYSTLTLEEDKYCNPGDLLFAWSASFGPFIWHGERSIYHYHIWKLDFYAKGQLSKHYLYNYLLEQTQDIKAAGHGVSMVHMTKEKMEKLVVPVPPLAEQERIVAKVDDLMALCDRLEAQQAESESARAQLVQVLLDGLTQTSDAIEFAINWQRLAENFQSLFTTETSIETLRKNLLQLAMMGKLVQQNPYDERAFETLKRVEEKNQLAANSCKSKKTKQTTEATPEIASFDLPNGWTIASVAQVGEIKLGRQRSPKDHFGEHMTPYLRVANVKENALDLSDVKEMNFTPAEQEIFRLQPGDILLNEGQSKELVGRPALFNGEIPGACFQNTLLRFRVYECVTPIYALRYFQSCMHSGRFQQAAQQTTNIAHLSASRLAAIEFPLPPLPEQHRIVAKVDQLIGFCDQLKMRLNQARQLNDHLANKLVESALVENTQQALVTLDRQVARTLLAAEITHQLHSQHTFGQRKLQKVIYLVEHTARLAAIQGNYLRDAAGPHDRHLMNKVEGELQNHQWYERIERETVGHAYRPLSQAGQHRQAYISAWSVIERATIEQVIELMRDWDTDRCEMTVTLYAAWNDFILEGRPVTDEAIVDEVMHSWNVTKLRFGKNQWFAVLAEMKKHKMLMPSGFGKRTEGGMRSLPGFE
ncbi:restriction endonuclease subunit S [Pseudomonas sp. B21-031]|uniref:restriction endonuclease subunit S n=1 Tax=Pseudomonas sp. B21-031 TaxID=2895482 RepID=UPI00215EE50E|nr:restriction endonuclease subunit S [Pseudomonas sp. B21-031]UVL66301.1 restriction endonuclease subunit S [Pseudomonas sp. B21-031]